MRRALFAAFATGLILGACSQPQPRPDESPAGAAGVDRIFSGGPIHTGVEGDLAAVEAVAVQDGRIVYVGDLAGAQAISGTATDFVDLDGAAMFPGFTDSHVHVIGVGRRERDLNLEDAASIEDLKARVAAAAEDASASYIYGRGWIETHWPEQRFPTRDDLDAVEAERPVILVRADGHALVANSAALEAAGVEDATPDPEGGEILRDEAGRATGMLIDTAMAPVGALVSEPEGEERAALYALGAEQLAASGWTGVHDMSVPYADVDIMAALAREGRFPIRTYVNVNPGDYDALAAAAPRVEAAGRVTARAVKVYSDGALGSRGAALLAPYSDAPGASGLLLMQQDEAVGLFERALRDGVQVATHAIGDRGNRLTLDWMEQAFEAVPAEARAVAQPRWRVEHAQVLSPEDLPRFAENGIIASMQPSHAIGDLHFAPARLGALRLDGAYAWRSIVESGAIIAGGSDAPVERGEARIEFYAAAVRRDLEGYAGENWNLDERVDRETALKMFTLWPAIASFREDELGTIEIGKRADFSVFDLDLMTAPDDALKDARPVMTVVDGEIVWRAAG